MTKKSNAKYKRIGIYLFTATVVAFLTLFGTSILNNTHQGYLRSLSRNVVLLHNSEGSGATGFLIKGKSGKRYIMTNGHVCNLNEGGYLFAIYKRDTYVVKVQAQYVWNDLCAIEAPESANDNFNTARGLSDGESAYAIGHPLLEPLTLTVGELSGYVTIQVVTAENPLPEQCFGPTYRIVPVFFGMMTVCVRTVPMLGGTISIQPGNSGSPVTNIYGHVIGVISASNGAGRSYSVPLEDLKDFLSSL